MVATAGEIKFGDGAAPTWGGTGQGSIYFNGIDGKPYARNSQTGAITPLGGGSVGLKYWLESTDAIVVPARYQYLTKGVVIADPGGTIVAAPGGQIEVIP